MTSTIKMDLKGTECEEVECQNAPVMDTSEYRNEVVSSTKGRQFLDQLQNQQNLKNSALERYRISLSTTYKLFDKAAIILETDYRGIQQLARDVGHLESKERLRIQPAQLFNFS